MNTPTYIKSLLAPNVSQPKGRKAWSVDIESVWQPFFTATNAAGQSNIDPAALGAPMRLAYDDDGTVKFNKNGKPVIRIAKPLSDAVKLVRDNMVAGLQKYTSDYIKSDVEGYKAQMAANHKAGQPILDADDMALEDANLAILEAAELAAAAATAEQEQPAEEVEQPAEEVEQPVGAGS